MNVAGSARVPMPALTCPEGMVATEFGADWVTSDAEAGAQAIIPSTETEPWVRDIPNNYPRCLTETCWLQLHQVNTGDSTTSCGSGAINCLDWYVSPARASDYECRWGPYEVDLSYCAVFRDPGNLLPNATVSPGGKLDREEWPALDLTSGVAERAIERTRVRYGSNACAALGEAVRSKIDQVSVPDMVLVCGTQGMATGLNFAYRSWPSTGTAPLIVALIETADGDPVTILEPECNHLSLDGRCLDEEGPESEPDPEPDPSGAGVRPPPNCLDAVGRQQLIDSMDEEAHHMATHYGTWGATFQGIVSKYGLNVKTGAWNLHSMPHAGPHPWNYHNWVLQRMQAADRIAQQFPAAEQSAVFLAEFQRDVTEVVLQDPTVVRAAYWKCRDYYKWR